MRLDEWQELELIRSDLSQYRVRAISLLRKYFKMSVELGRLPSLLGREFFRTQVTSYSTNTFEDAVIFVHDMERALEATRPASQLIIARVIFQEYSYAEASKLLGIQPRTFLRAMAAAIDELSAVMLERKLMEPVNAPVSAAEIRRIKQVAEPPKMPCVSVGRLLELVQPKF